MKTISCDLLTRKCLCVNLGGGGKYACFDEPGLPSSQVEILSYQVSRSDGVLYTEVNLRTLRKEKVLWPLGHSIMHI